MAISIPAGFPLTNMFYEAQLPMIGRPLVATVPMQTEAGEAGQATVVVGVFLPLPPARPAGFAPPAETHGIPDYLLVTVNSDVTHVRVVFGSTDAQLSAGNILHIGKFPDIDSAIAAATDGLLVSGAIGDCRVHILSSTATDPATWDESPGVAHGLLVQRSIGYAVARHVSTEMRRQGVVEQLVAPLAAAPPTAPQRRARKTTPGKIARKTAASATEAPPAAGQAPAARSAAPTPDSSPTAAAISAQPVVMLSNRRHPAGAPQAGQQSTPARVAVRA